MANMVVRKVKNLDAAAKRSLQKLLGRQLQAEEEVTVMVFSAHPAPPPAVRRAAFARLEKILDKAAEKLKDVPDSEFEAAVDEAMAHVRRRKP